MIDAASKRIFSRSKVHVHLDKSMISSKLHIIGKVISIDDVGIVLGYGKNQITLFPWFNILRVDVLEEREEKLR